MTDSEPPSDSSSAPHVVERTGRSDAREASTLRTSQDLRSRALENAFVHAPIGVMVSDLEWGAVDVNEALCRLTGYSRAELLGTAVPFRFPADLDADSEDRRRLLHGEISTYQTETRCVHASGHDILVLASVSLARDETGRPLRFVSQIQDISERRVPGTHVEEWADRDVLTGVLNRRAFERELLKEIRRATRYGLTGAVLLIDFDRFARINDRHGHQAGDALLRTVADTLGHRVRQTDILARVGGDQFAVILPQIDVGQAEVVADEIVKAFRRPASDDDQSMHATVSVGVALFDSQNNSHVLAQVELALHEAKDAGRDRFARYESGLGARRPAREHFGELERIHQALNEDRFLLYCQPIVDLASNQISQYELLLRLDVKQSPTPLEPSAFLDLAEHFGLIQSIDCWVVRRAIALLAEQTRAGRPLVLHVNVSAKSIGDPTFAAATESALAEAVIDPAHLILELTETAAIANIESARRFTTRLRKFGCQLALDDFGAGFGSFQNLKYLPFDLLKIDGDFVRNLANGAVDQLVVKAIVSIARGMGKKTVAEFVETADVTRLLRETGVDYGQGYYLGPPRPIAEVL